MSRSVSLSNMTALFHTPPVYLLALLMCVLLCGCKSNQKQGTDEQMSAHSILPPTGMVKTYSDQDKKDINRLFQELPEDAKDSSSDIVIPVEKGATLDSRKALSDEERRRQEFLARRTDNEIMGHERTIDERHSKDVSALDRELGLVPEEKKGEYPSYVLTLESIKAYYQERQYERALIETNEALRFYPKSAKLLNMKGTLHQKLGNLELALISYKRAYEIEPTQRLLVQIDHLSEILAEQKARKNDQNRLVIPGDKSETSLSKGDN